MGEGGNEGGISPTGSCSLTMEVILAPKYIGHGIDLQKRTHFVLFPSRNANTSMCMCFYLACICIWDRFSVKRDLTHAFSKFQFCLKCPLHIASYALRIRLSVMEL